MKGIARQLPYSKRRWFTKFRLIHFMNHPLISGYSSFPTRLCHLHFGFRPKLKFYEPLHRETSSLFIKGKPSVCSSYLVTSGIWSSQYQYQSSQEGRPKASLTHLSKPSESSFSQDKIVKNLKFSEVKRLFTLAKPETWTLTGGITLLAVSSVITMAVPFALGHVIDIIYTADPVEMKQNLNNVCLGLIGIFLTGGLANFGRVYFMNVAGQRITRSLRASVFSSIMKQEIAFFDQNKTGELVNRLSADTSVVSQAVTMNISDGLRSFVMVLAGVGMMFYMSTDLAVVGLSIVPPVALMAVAFGRYLRILSKRVQDILAESTQVAEERISSVRTVRAFAQEFKEIEKYDNKIENVLNLTYKEALARGLFFGLTGLSGNIIILSVLYYGGSLVTQSALTVGQLSSFLLYAAYVGVAFGGLSSFYTELNRGLGASTRLFQLIERVPSIPISEGHRLSPETLKGCIHFKNISFAYPTRPDHQIFSSFSLEVPAGNVIALVGASGSGKSTIASLLLRFYDPQGGEICIDSTPIHLLDPACLRSIIASVSQEPALFSASILENILYGCSNPEQVSMEEVVRAAMEANAFPFIEAFPDKFETVVGERGVMLSGGQKQRVAIARAIIGNPKILLLDEATSALDAESESLVQEALERLMKNKTVITIAHRLSTIRNADKIAVLHEGGITEMGTYDDLMQRERGLFRKLVERQTITS